MLDVPNTLSGKLKVRNSWETMTNQVLGQPTPRKCQAGTTHEQLDGEIPGGDGVLSVFQDATEPEQLGRQGSVDRE